MLSKNVYKNIELIRAEVRDALLLPGAIKQSTHLFRRGLEEPYYVDFDVLVNDPYLLEQIVNLFAVKIMEINAKHQIDLLAFIEKYSGGTTGAIRLAGAISMITRIPNIAVRLTRNICSERVKVPPIVGKPIREKLSGTRILVVTDHATTGGELLNAIDSIEYSGGKVTDALAFSARTDEILLKDFASRDVTFDAIYSLPKDAQAIGLVLTQ